MYDHRFIQSEFEGAGLDADTERKLRENFTFLRTSVNGENKKSLVVTPDIVTPDAATEYELASLVIPASTRLLHELLIFDLDAVATITANMTLAVYDNGILLRSVTVGSATEALHTSQILIAVGNAVIDVALLVAAVQSASFTAVAFDTSIDHTIKFTVSFSNLDAANRYKLFALTQRSVLGDLQ